jgi:nucleotide-binding universal stress UspA family protein
MFTRIVVGVDEHEGGRDAIALARRLLSDGGQLVLTNVHAGDARIYRAPSGHEEATGHARALELLEAMCREDGIEAWVESITASSVSRGLHALAVDARADLIVVGSSRHHLLGRVFMGDDTQATLDSAPCAVAIAPAGYATVGGPIRTVGLAYNGTPESDHALRLSRKLAHELGARLSACEAVSIPLAATTPGPLPLEDAVDTLQARARDQLVALGDVEPQVVYGPPATELTAYSRSVDLLVVGSRCHGALGRMLYGSMAHTLARTSHCPLLVLTRGARGAVVSGPARVKHSEETWV